MQDARALLDQCEIIVRTGSSLSKFSTIDNNILWEISFTCAVKVNVLQPLLTLVKMTI